MKITKSQIRKIIREEKARLLEVGDPPDINAAGWHPNDSEEWERQAREEQEQDDDSEVNEDGDALWVMADDLVSQTKMGRISAEAPDDSPDGEVYFDLGGGEGITVKTLRRGR
jgi:hypothetical protein